LRGTLAGYWKLRIGDWRVVYAIRDHEVIVFAIKHRSRIYDEVNDRL
jgi:mRNA interferase RelE/StbE